MADPHTSPQAIGLNVRRLRELAGLSQAEVADRLKGLGVEGIYPQTITKIESGTRALKLIEGVALAQTLGVDAAELVGLGPHQQMLAEVRQLRRKVDGARKQARLELVKYIRGLRSLRRGTQPGSLEVPHSEYYAEVLRRLDLLYPVPEPDSLQMSHELVYEDDPEDARMLQEIANRVAQNLVVLGERPRVRFVDGTTEITYG